MKLRAVYIALPLPTVIIHYNSADLIKGAGKSLGCSMLYETLKFSLVVSSVQVKALVSCWVRLTFKGLCIRNCGLIPTKWKANIVFINNKLQRELHSTMENKNGKCHRLDYCKTIHLINNLNPLVFSKEKLPYLSLHIRFLKNIYFLIKPFSKTPIYSTV